MKTFYGDTFIKIADLAMSKIYYPIKLEYYKIWQETENENRIYGIEIVKKKYVNKSIQTEQEKILEITKSEEKIEEILQIIKMGQVTPVSLKYVVEDLM